MPVLTKKVEPPVPVEPKVTYSIEFTQEELQALRNIVGRIAGGIRFSSYSPYVSRYLPERQLTTALYDSIQDHTQYSEESPWEGDQAPRFKAPK